MTEVKFHDIGEGMTEGEIVRYLIAPGDRVKVDEPLVEIQTDKMVAELPSPVAGIIDSIHVEEGTVVSVGTVLLEIAGEERVPDSYSQASKKDNSPEERTGDDANAQMVHTPAPVSRDESQTSGKQPPKRIKAAPYTRKVARELDVDIEEVEGTGPSGRITVEDVQQFKETIDTGQSAAVKESIPNESSTIPFTGIRKQIAKNMTASLTTIPHVTHFDEVDLTYLSEVRKRLKMSGESISIAAFFVKALALTLREFPVMNGELDEKNDVIRLHNHYHIGIATDTEKGLLVPVIKHVEEKSIRHIHAEMKALTKKAQAGELSIHEMQGGTFTMSNVGPLGGTGATPIINHPQTSIIAFHKTKKTPVVMEDDDIAIRSIMTMSLSFDHRVCDGAMAVRFTNQFAEWMEKPERLLLELT